MNETNVTVVGHVATEPVMRTTAAGVKVTSFRLASTERRFDRQLAAWRDGATIFYTVTCWRAAAENVQDSVCKGQPVMVHGRLRVSGYDDKDGQHRTVVEVDAQAVGHDLTRGVASFTKALPVAEAAAALVRELDEEEPFDPVTGEVLSVPAGDEQSGGGDARESAA